MRKSETSGPTIDPKAASIAVKAKPIVQSVVDFAPPSKTRGAELIPVSENPCLNIAHSDCFAALCAACAGAQEGDLHLSLIHI